MPNYPQEQARYDEYGARGLKGAPGRPLTSAEHVVTAHAISGNNDLATVIADLRTRMAAALDSDDLVNILSDVADVVDYSRFQGPWRARAYTAGQTVVASDTQFYEALVNVGADVPEPTATTDKWKHLTASLELSTARFHQFLYEHRSKINEDDWGTLPVGHQFRVGDVVKRFLQWFVCEVAHAKGATGPDNDPTNWSPITNYAGDYDAAKYYHEGVSVKYRGWLAYSLADIVPNDPAPDHPDNVKWWYSPNDQSFVPWKYAEPSGGLDDLEVSAADAQSGAVENVTTDVDDDRVLVRSIAAAQAAGLKTEMHISGKVEYFLKQDAPLSNNSGAILGVNLWLGADPRAGVGPSSHGTPTRYLTQLDHNALTLADYRNSNGGRDSYGTNPDVEKTFSLLLNEEDFHDWNLRRDERLTFVLLGNSINGFASVKAEISDVAISYDRTPANLDALRQEVVDLIEAFAKHQEVVVNELPDPESSAAPAYAYLSRIWRPTQGFDGNQGVVEYSPGEYRLTEGTANRAKVVFGAGSYASGSSVNAIKGFIQRGERLRVGSSHFLSDIGEALHNPVGGAIAGIFWTNDPSNIFTSAASWVMWVKNSLASRKPPWNIPTNVEQGGLHVRLYHDSTHIDINFAHGGSFETVDGIEYQYYYAQDRTGATWINALDVSDIDASTVELEARRATDSQLLWLGDSTHGWTWIDPDENPTAISRIDRIERGSLVQGALLASISGPASPGQLTGRDWTIAAGTSGITKATNHGTGNWTRYLYIDPDIHCQSLSGHHGLLIVVERGGAVVSSSFLPFTTAHAQWTNADEVFVGKWKTGASNANTLNAAFGVDSGLLNLRLACSGADADSTVKIYRTN